MDLNLNNKGFCIGKWSFFEIPKRNDKILTSLNNNTDVMLFNLLDILFCWKFSQKNRCNFGCSIGHLTETQEKEFKSWWFSQNINQLRIIYYWKSILLFFNIDKS